MRIIGISGSPRVDGNTEVLVRAALEGAKLKGAEIEFVALSGKKIEGCLACTECGRNGKCVIEDDMQAIYPKMMAADGVIIGTPIYFGQMTSQTKGFIDRTYLLNKLGRKLEGKVGGVIAVGGRAGHEFTTVALMDYMTIQGMILPPKAFAHSYAREPGAAGSDEKSLKEARALGERVVSLATRLEPTR
ncbi:MAG: flavodoxin family protein [Methanomassiliicoccales archaeon]|jgi:multimeric flavodoxin WrbA